MIEGQIKELSSSKPIRCSMLNISTHIISPRLFRRDCVCYIPNKRKSIDKAAVHSPAIQTKSCCLLTFYDEKLQMQKGESQQFLDSIFRYVLLIYYYQRQCAQKEAIKTTMFCISLYCRNHL
eukprot:TRINITY_DN876_c0_g1_i2.p1 TRINITY_DN876_c0_g1~~TRINITY_DN876_c0_g1_i2.p1  ORF type:complete len:122 (-),score=7.52 TRINITY_DN876_c0_g1_i2:44-409(-)